MSQLARLPASNGARRVATLGLAALGAALFWALDLPLPFLFGPMSACLVAALMGAPLRGTGPVSKAARTILGVAVGASITPEVLSQLPKMAASVAFVPVYILVIGAIGVPYFRKVCGFDMATSYYAAMPGGLQDMVIFGQEAGADVRALSLIHATRVLVIVTVVPFLLIHLFDRPLAQPIGAPASDLPISEMALMAVAALVGWKGGERIGLFGATIIGPLIVTAALSLMGFIDQRPPKEAILAAQFFIGIGIGVGYVGVTLHELRKDVLAGVVYVLILALLAFVVTEIVVLAGFANPVEGFLSFAPGGQAEMTVLAIVAGADLGFIVVHHLTRIILVITGAPIVAALLRLRRRE
ncbi:ammonia monooxygenase [Roseivivax marinus]|jgi:membrane AbrB-like protein|uniref:Ammonia monooxygenase n=1 Tax=Roseivivax marinus TaxID=1379903 RepID=W4HGL2_9RHOB|nr:AbrB family transcriptional regulator [Roseivivax marinus]ETW11533.1 ammonia monooxygenase [Roseivivax marinus]UMA67164.1 AbrB family transcriptional regulator [Roseivivax marinus]